MRGKASSWIKEGTENRITPAYAGKSSLSFLLLLLSGDHPRMCGEKTRNAPAAPKRRGSPPHVRGKVHAVETLKHSGGITPACAGKRPRTPLAGSSSRGSPPHVRGKACRSDSADFWQGITPACAGKSGCRTPEWPNCRDHPRMCGEKTLGGMESHPARGSPPHVRGKVKQLCVLIALRGITPACAGKSCCFAGCSAGSGDHPRMCGEKLPGSARAPLNAGSPPHVRGKD